MNNIDPELFRLLLRAAEMRAAGNSWETIAKETGQSLNCVRAWPSDYPDVWQQALYEGQKKIIADAGAEALVALRTSLRSDDEKVKNDAARFLLNLKVEFDKRERDAVQTTSTRDDVWHRLADHLGSLSDAELHLLSAVHEYDGLRYEARRDALRLIKEIREMLTTYAAAKNSR